MKFLEDFRSPVVDDADGGLWVVSALLTEAKGLIEAAREQYESMDCQAVNTVKTIVPIVMETLVHSTSDEVGENIIARYIAQNEKLLDTLLLLIRGHMSKLYSCNNY